MNGESEHGNDGHGELHEVDLNIVPANQPSRPKWLIPLIGAIALPAMIIAGVMLTNNDDSEVDAAADDVSIDAVEDEAVDDVAPTTTTSAPPSDSADAVAPPADFATEEAMDVAYAVGDGPGGVVFDGEKFVSFGHGQQGPTLRTSTDGVEWDERPLSGFQANAHPSMLVEHNGSFATVLEHWDPESAGEESMFGSTEGPTYSLAVSTDLERWELTELSFDEKDGHQSHVGGLALGDAGVVILSQSYPQGPDEMRLLFDAGILTEEDFESYCGLDFDGDSILVTTCDFEGREEPDGDKMAELVRRYDEAETEEEREAIEAEFESINAQPQGEPIATITADDPLYAELAATRDYEHEEFPTTLVHSGPLTGPFTSVPLTSPGHVEGVVATTSGFAMVVHDYERGSTSSLLTSQDGRDWTETGTLPVGGQLHAIGDTLLVAGSNDRDGAPAIHRSTNNGTTWDSVDLPVDLFSAYPMVATGPAGAAVFVTGALEPYPEYGPTGPVEIAKDGYTLILDLAGSGGISLLGPDGEAIHTLTELELEAGGDGDIAGVLRLNPISDTPTFLDPETGEDLVAFTNEDFEQAYSAFEGQEPHYEEPEMSTVVLFSVDGASWTVIDDERLASDQRSGATSLVAVGDDELIAVRHTWSEPPAELLAFEQEGREPTDEEIAAIQSWEMSSGGGESQEYIRIEIN